MANNSETGLRVIPVMRDYGRGLLVMTCYLPIHLRGTVCSVKHYKHKHNLMLLTPNHKLWPAKFNYIPGS